MKRAVQPIQTKEKLLAAAQQLMQVKGYAATTVDEICEDAGLTKGSFFHYFESKEDLGKAVLDRYISWVRQSLQEAVFQRESDPLRRLYRYFDFFIELAENPDLKNGCLLGNFAQELSDTHPEIRALCARYFGHWAAALKRHIDEAKAKYARKASWDTQSLAEHFIAVLEGSLVLAKAHQDPALIEKNLRHFKQYMEALFER